jgi:serine/threonine protein kinase
MKGSCSMVEIQETLGSGSFATVQLAQVEHLPSSVAVKHFTRKEYRENESRELINNEIRMLRKCNHSSIVGFHGVLKTDNRIYLIMEKVEGISL